MMEFLIIEEVISVVGCLAGEVNHDPESIEIGENASQCDELAITEIVRGLGRYDPAGEQMCYGRHGWQWHLARPRPVGRLGVNLRH